MGSRLYAPFAILGLIAISIMCIYMAFDPSQLESKSNALIKLSPQETKLSLLFIAGLLWVFIILLITRLVKDMKEGVNDYDY